MNWGHNSWLVGFALILPTCSISWAAEPEAPTNVTDEEKLEKVKEMFKSPYTEEDYYRTDRLLVTATGSQLPIHKAPAVASVITAEDIEKIGATSLDDILETVPGLHVVPSFDRMSSMFSLRGIHTNTNPQILLLMNGMAITQTLHGHRISTFRLPVADISRVEVVRGPGSAVHGADAFAGTINIVTKDCHELKTIKTGVRAGSFDTYAAWMQGGWTTNGWDLNLSLEYGTSNGDKDRIIDADLQTALDGLFGTTASKAPGALNTTYNILNANVGVRKDNWNARLWYWRQDDAGVGTNSDNVLAPASWEDAEQLLADVTYENDKLAGDWAIDATLSYVRINDNVFFMLFPPHAVVPIGADGNLFTDGGAPVAFPDGVVGHPSAAEDQYAADIEAFYTGFNQHRLRFGGGLKYIDMDSSELKNFGPGVIDGSDAVVDGALTDVSDTQFVYMRDRTRSVWYLSIQDEWSFARRWELTAGVRFDQYSDFGSTINPRAALVWEARYDLTAKLLYGQAFRPPSFGELYLANNPAGLGNRDLEPETIETLELVFDHQPTSNLHTILNLFTYKIEDLIEYVPDVGTNTATAQNAEDRVGYGFEFEMEWEINRFLYLRGSYAYQYSVRAGTRKVIPDAPRQQVHLNPRLNLSSEWSLDGQIKWIGDRKRAEGDTRDEIDDYALLGLTLRRRNLWQHWDLSVAVRNLLDEDDVREPTSAAIPNDYPMAGRSIFAEVAFHY